MKWYWVVLIAIVVILICRRRRKDEARPGQTKSASLLTPLDNLASDLLAAADGTGKLVSDMVSKLTSATQNKYSKDMVDDSAIAQHEVMQYDFLNTMPSQSEKILGIDPLTGSRKSTMKRDHMWWPERMYDEAPLWAKELQRAEVEGKLLTIPCECGCGESRFEVL